MNAGKPDMSEINTSNIVSIVHTRLTEAILSGSIGPGEKIVEAELARRMNISRGPLREAARLLEQQGLLESKPRRGFFVKEFGPEEIDNLFEIRACLQVEAARLAVRRMKPRDIKEMRRRCRAVEDAVDRNESADKALVAALHFHRLIFEMTGNRRFVRAFDDLAMDTQHVATVLNTYEEKRTGKTDTFFKEHLPPIVKAFEQGDPDLVASVIRIYLEEARRDHAEIFARMRAATSGPAAGKSPSKSPSKRPSERAASET